MRIRSLIGPPVVLTLLWLAAVYVPSQRSISSANDQLVQTQDDQLALVTEIDELNQSESQLPEVERDLEITALAIPDAPMVGAFVATIAAAAADSGVQVNLVSPTEVLDITTNDPNRTVPSGLTAVVIAIEAEGTFENTMAFAAGLEDLSRLIVVDQLAMVAVDGSDQLIILDMTLRIFATGGPVAADVEAADPFFDDALFGEEDAE